MRAEDARSQLEIDLAWRTEEIKLLTNQLGLIVGERNKERFCRTLLVMLYAHVEGFTKSAIRIYVKAICEETISVKNVNERLGSNCLIEIFAAVENSNPHPFFKTQAPPKHKLNRAFRITEIIKRWEEIQNSAFNADGDDIAETESNLNRTVLRKILYRVGLDLDEFDEFEEDLEALVARRNPIAHGEIATVVSWRDYIKLETNALLFMEELVRVITSSLVEKRYLADGEKIFPMI